MGDTLSSSFIDAADTKVRMQIAKATALDSELLQGAIEKAISMQQSIETRVAYREQRSKPQSIANDVHSDLCLETGHSIPISNVSLGQNVSRNQKQRRNVNPPPPSTSTYYYYQSASGFPVFLHPLDIKILNAHFNGYVSFPDSITIRVESSTEVLSMTTCASDVNTLVTCQRARTLSSLRPTSLTSWVWTASAISRARSRTRRARRKEKVARTTAHVREQKGERRRSCDDGVARVHFGAHPA